MCRPSAAGGQRATLSTFPQVPLTPEPTCTQAFDPGTSGSTLSPADTSQPFRSSGHFPNFPWPGSPWLAHGSPLHGDRFPNPTGLLLSILRLPSSPGSQPRDVSFPCATSRHPSRRIPRVPCLPILLGLSCGPSPTPFSVPSPSPFIACLYPTGPPATLWRGPTGSSSIRGPFRAPSTGRFLPAPVPFPCATSRHPSRPTPHVPRLPILLGLTCGPSHTHSLSRPLFPSSRVYIPPGRQQPFGTSPLDPHPSGDRFVCLALVAPFPPPSVWVVCFFKDLLGPFFLAPPPLPPAPVYSCLFPTWSPAVVFF